MIACGYYRNAATLPMQLAFIAGPIALPLIVASLAPSRRTSVWSVTAAILAVGWVYVVYCDTRLDPGGGASFAVIVGWFAAVIALAVALLLTLALAARRR
ncbi:hypothetical protein Q5H91_13665 [Sphingomonas sp. KR1UV-12]|uniref:Uncharacterized protein n=1 Tax=Sphingomonas aurea TaxID=3063994 RepID=A0ABT9EN67_9SPHN|nr:hypothetical protein [Sphingomonas sp. KR1UV-12]MDP1028267.1 hypothetical protein [Sphingomonas sp. KR1UV-12]